MLAPQHAISPFNAATESVQNLQQLSQLDTKWQARSVPSHLVTALQLQRCSQFPGQACCHAGDKDKVCRQEQKKGHTKALA